MLVLLDLSAAFDMVDHDVLLKRMETSFGITGKALDWFVSYIYQRYNKSTTSVKAKFKKMTNFN